MAYSIESQQASKQEEVIRSQVHVAPFAEKQEVSLNVFMGLAV
jgi:hypothetical protein